MAPPGIIADSESSYADLKQEIRALTNLRGLRDKGLQSRLTPAIRKHFDIPDDAAPGRAAYIIATCIKNALKEIEIGNQDPDKFPLGVMISFNISIPQIFKKNLIERRRYVDKNPVAGVTVSPKSSDTYTSDFITYIAQHPVAPSKPTDTDISLLDEKSENVGRTIIPYPVREGHGYRILEEDDPGFVPVPPRGFLQRRKWQAGLGATVAAITVTAFIYFQSGDSAQPGKNSSDTLDNLALERDFGLTYTYTSDVQGGISTAFAAPRDLTAEEKFQFEDPASPSERQTLFSRQMEAGGYAYGGLVLTLNFARTDRDVTIKSVEAIHAIPGKPTTDVLFYNPNLEGLATQLGVRLDQPRAEAVIYDAKTGSYGDPYFAEHPLILRQGEPQSIAVHFRAPLSSYTFNIAVQYEIDGQPYTREIRDSSANVTIFRATGNLCDPLPPGANADVRADRAKLRYFTIYRATGNGNPPQKLESDATDDFVRAGCQ
ncbi:hypothetical protein L6E12_03770 [Actinokineospora sp. PR83]|uniref:hypothetical protein n=1 Tax=Actinokineospora sp. PR83 TaxID=2884908 RepID=UPI001F24ECCE|nr:hypothetical protein [Actinokineospora sp. PR83]MCG8914907.1 hypothetical protein [Actinokineospora sp. PR83]